MKSKETLRFISNNIKGCKTKIALLSICQILLGALTVAFSFMLRYIIGAIEARDKDQLILYIIILSSIAVALILLYNNVKDINVNLESGIYFVNAGDQTMKVVVK